MNTHSPSRSRPFQGVRVLDASTVIAAPLAAMILGDFGAEVIKIEHPHGGDPARTHGHERDGTPLWWLMLGRNKKSVTLYLGAEEGQQIFRELAATADVIIENFRPGVMERWGLGYESLSSTNAGLIMAHVSGFGRTGPLADEPGFGTIGEAMSGFAFRNGSPDGPPMLPPFGLADGVAGISTALAVVTALYERQQSMRGQELDLSIMESLLTVLEPQVTTQDQLGLTLSRTGNRADMNAPRGLYLAADGNWVALSASTTGTAARLMEVVGSAPLADSAWFASARGRHEHVEEIDTVIVPWVAARSAAAAVAELRDAGVPVAPVYSAQDIMCDPQFEAVGSIGTVNDHRLGAVRMPNPLFRMSASPGRIDWPGEELGAHTDSVLQELGISSARRRELRSRFII